MGRHNKSDRRNPIKNSRENTDSRWTFSFTAWRGAARRHEVMKPAADRVAFAMKRRPRFRTRAEPSPKPLPLRPPLRLAPSCLRHPAMLPLLTAGAAPSSQPESHPPTPLREAPPGLPVRRRRRSSCSHSPPHALQMVCGTRHLSAALCPHTRPRPGQRARATQRPSSRMKHAPPQVLSPRASHDAP